MGPVRATVLQLSLDLQLRTLQLSRYVRTLVRSKRRKNVDLDQIWSIIDLRRCTRFDLAPVPIRLGVLSCAA